MPKGIRELVRIRAANCCEYCQMPQALDVQPFQLDHIRAEKHGGRTTLRNLALACFPCNTYKGPNIAGYDPVTNSLQRLFHARRDKWIDHFAWRRSVLVGKTPIGGTTIAVLAINADDRVEHRRMLIEARVFPPRLD
jgi:HNH endonuclease